MDISRRGFLQTTAIAGGAVMAGAGPLHAATRNGMPYRILGKTGIEVSLLCLGGAHIGERHVSDEQSIAIMRHAVDEGINFFDNAWAYHEGRSEILMGRALKDGYRDRVFLMTKHKGLDAATAQEHLETSLRRMEVDVIDLWQFHEIVHPDQPRRIYDNDAIDYALKAKEEGKIRYIGFTGHHINTTHLEMLERGFDWATIQMPLNVFDHHFRSFERNVLPRAVERGMGILAMKTMGGSAAYPQDGTPPRANLLETGAVTPEECLRYAMSLPVTSVVSGMDTMEILKRNLEIAKDFTPYTQAELAALREKVKPYAETGVHEIYKTTWHRGSIEVPAGNDPNPSEADMAFAP